MHNLPAVNPRKITTTLREYKGGKNYQDFKRECLLYILANKRAFPSHKKKILFVLSYLKEGTTAVQAENWVAQYTDNDDNIYCLNTFQAFMNQLGKSFEDSSKKETAIQRLRQLKQGSKSANVFFQQFEILKTKAGLKNEVYNTVLIDLLQYLLNTEVLRQFIHIYPVFTTYKDQKGYTIQINNNKTCLREALNCRGLSGNYQKG